METVHQRPEQQRDTMRSGMRQREGQVLTRKEEALDHTGTPSTGRPVGGLSTMDASTEDARGWGGGGRKRGTYKNQLMKAANPCFSPFFPTLSFSKINTLKLKINE